MKKYKCNKKECSHVIKAEIKHHLSINVVHYREALHEYQICDSDKVIAKFQGDIKDEFVIPSEMEHKRKAIQSGYKL